MEIVARTPDEFLSSLAGDVRPGMAELDRLITSHLRARARVLWEGIFWGGTAQSIIGYGHITQPRPRGDDVHWFLVGLARQKNHFSVYVNAAEEGSYLGQRYADRLGKVKVGSASIAIRSIDGLDTDGFGQLIARADKLTPPDTR